MGGSGEVQNSEMGPAVSPAPSAAAGRGLGE